MAVELQDELLQALKIAGFIGNLNLLAMHLSEIEDEAETGLDLLTTPRSHAHRGDSVAVQESLTELTISLEHLLDHVQHVLPSLHQQLDIAERQRTS